MATGRFGRGKDARPAKGGGSRMGAWPVLLRFVAVLAACALPSGGPAWAAQPGAGPPVQAQRGTEACPVSILVLGDSIAAGYGLAPEHSFPRVLQELLAQNGHAAEVVNAGVSGDTTADGLARLPGHFPPRSRSRPAVLVLELGANDGIQGRNLEEVEADLDAMLALAREQGAQVLLAGARAGSRRSDEYRMAFAGIYLRLASRHGVALYPVIGAGIYGNPEFLQPDGAHPNEAGARLIAVNLYPHVAELLARAGRARPCP